MHILGVALTKIRLEDIQVYLGIEERLLSARIAQGVVLGRATWLISNPLSGSKEPAAITLELRTAILLGCLGLYASWYKAHRQPGLEENAGGYLTLAEWMHHTLYAAVPTDPTDDGSPPRRVTHGQRIREWLTIPLLTQVAGLQLDDEGCVDPDALTAEAKEKWAQVIGVLMRMVGTVGTGEARRLIAHLEKNRAEVFTLDQRRPNVYGFSTEFLPKWSRMPVGDIDVETFRRDMQYGLRRATDMTLRALAHFSLSIVMDQLPDALWIVARRTIVEEQARRAARTRLPTKPIVRPAEPDEVAVPEAKLEVDEEPQQPVVEGAYRSRLVEQAQAVRRSPAPKTETHRREPAARVARARKPASRRSAGSEA